ncbi:DUF2179 domain-containing protein [Dysgonomonas sp. Marseille-P4677]|uniref:DUF2179 domain-containing protein n=1 Tax=Dysgonomonas sp. Marseille-P4677 TaxID=2364790 RepID=UPI001912810B|nr:DUF5698 domain-containing protein [Dysgonomonas sp. Marseille-P4677]MBK5719605.1 DUF2179 domain-containing protein [Dysgonomonas sp. Marseille-P4677]
MFDIFDLYPWLLPIVIFLGRICDVTLGTLRIIFVSKGERYKAPLVGFVEVFIWVVIISQIFAQTNSIVSYLAYAAGYAAGNYVGILVENKIAFGYQLLRVYTKKEGTELIKALNKINIGATFIKGEGAISAVHIVEIVINRKSLNEVINIISSFDPDVFYLVEDIRYKKKGIFASKH